MVTDQDRKNIFGSPVSSGQYCGQSTPTHGDNTETSDFDSISTTSASYVVTNSDVESLSIDDNQLDILMNKTDLSDLDQLDTVETRTITGSCSDTDTDTDNMISGHRSNNDEVVSGGDQGQDPGQVSSVGLSSSRARSLVCGASTGPGPGQAGAESVWSDQCGETQVSDKKSSEHVNNSYTPGAPLSRDTSLPAQTQLKTSSNQQSSAAASNDLVETVPRQEKQSAQISFSAIDSDRVTGISDKNRLTKRKGSVSDLIAKFESSSRSATPERSLTPDSHRSLRSATPVTSTSTTSSSSRAVQKQNSVESNQSVAGEEEKSRVKDTGARPKVPQNKNKPLDCAVSNTNEANESLISNESEPAELRGLREFTQKYLREQQAKNGSSTTPVIQESLDHLDGEVEDILDNPDMPPTVRRNSGSGGAYTSYVFISSDPSNDDVASVVSSNGSYTDPENRVTVNVKETGVVSPNTCVVSIQDGRTSNISIVSTESSELNSPRQSPTTGLDDGPPELPTKVKVGTGKSHSELQQIVFATRESLRDYSHRSRGGEADIDRPYDEEDDQASDRSGQELNKIVELVCRGH